MPTQLPLYAITLHFRVSNLDVFHILIAYVLDYYLVVMCAVIRLIYLCPSSPPERSSWYDPVHRVFCRPRASAAPAS